MGNFSTIASCLAYLISVGPADTSQKRSFIRRILAHHLEERVDLEASGSPGKLDLDFQEQEGCLWTEVVPASLCDLQTESHWQVCILC